MPTNNINTTNNFSAGFDMSFENAVTHQTDADRLVAAYERALRLSRERTGEPAMRTVSQRPTPRPAPDMSFSIDEHDGTEPETESILADLPSLTISKRMTLLGAGINRPYTRARQLGVIQ